MSIQVKDPAGAWRTTTQPWIKPDNITWRPTVKVFNKVAGVWRESWPLKPNAPGAPVVTTTYRNDRIEMDVSWAASSGGEPVAKYIVTIWIGGSSTAYVVNAPTTSITLTNGGDGYHAYASQGATAVVYAQSAAGRNSDSVAGASTTIAQLPAPPPPTSYSVSMSACALYHSWSHPGGRRITGVEMHVYHESNGAAAYYDANTFGAYYQSWNTSTIGGGWVQCFLRTTGPGGVSGWLSVSGSMPNPISTWAYRFGDGYLRANTSGVFPQVQIHALAYGGGWAYQGDFGSNVSEVYVPNSVNWPRDMQSYGMLLRPINNANGWTGRDQWLGWAKKLPNPFNIAPVDSQTWRGWGWRSEQDQDWQGASQSGLNAAFFFYGNQFYDYLSAANVGYDVGITAAAIALWRENTGGLGQPVSPYLMVHRAGWIGEDIGWGGSYATVALNRGWNGWCTVPTDWVWMLKERWDGWKGIGLYHPNEQLLSYIGYVSAEYMIMKAWNYGTFEGNWLDTVRVHHNG